MANLKYRSRKRKVRRRLPPYGFKEEEIKLEVNRKSPPSVFHINYRSIFEDNYPAKFDDELARTLIQLYTEEGETVLDPMAGSGVIPINAVKMERNAIAIDINRVAIQIIKAKYELVEAVYQRYGKLKMIQKDSKLGFDLTDNSVDFILTSPPFGLSIDMRHDKYSNAKGDLANAKTYDEWRAGLNVIMQECLRVLRPGKLMAIEIRPRSKDGHSYPLFAWITQDAQEIGFDFYTDYIEVVIPYAMWTMGDKYARKPFPVHSYLLVFKKPENSKIDKFTDNGNSR